MMYKSIKERKIIQLFSIGHINTAGNGGIKWTKDNMGKFVIRGDLLTAESNSHIFINKSQAGLNLIAFVAVLRQNLTGGHSFQDNMLQDKTIPTDNQGFMKQLRRSYPGLSG